MSSLRKLSDKLYFDWKTFLIIASILVLAFNILYPYSAKIIIPEIGNQIHLLELVLRVISLFFAISFSFIILSFNVFYKNFGRYAFIQFFRSKEAKICISLLTSSIVVLLYSISFLSEITTKTSYSNFLFVFSIVLCAISFFSVFPLLINLLNGSQNREHIKSILNRLKTKEYHISRFKARVTKDYNEFYSEDPISLLKEIGFIAIKDFDANTFHLITIEMIKLLEDEVLVKNEKDLKIDVAEVFYNFRSLLNSFYAYALKERNRSLSVDVINTRYDLELLALKNKSNEALKNFNSNDHIYYHFDIKDFLKRSILHKEDELCENIFINYRLFASEQILLESPQKIEFDKSKRFEIADKFKCITDTLRNISEYGELLIKEKKSNLIYEVFQCFTDVESSILEIDNPNETKCFLLNILYNNKKRIYIQSIETFPDKRVNYLNFPFKEGISRFLSIKCNIPFLHQLEMVDFLFSKGKLNNVVINLMKADMLHLIREKEYQSNLFVSLINKFQAIASKIKDTDSDQHKGVYILLFEKLKFIEQELSKEEDIPSNLSKILSNAVKSFKKVKKYDDELNDKGHIIDKRI